MTAVARSIVNSVFAIVCAAMVMTGCKAPNKQTPLQSAAPTPTPNGASAQAGALVDGCNPPSCPKAQDLALQSNGAIATSISGQVGFTINLNLTAKSTQYPGRVFVVYAFEPSPILSSMTIKGNKTPAASMTWSPYSTDSSSGTVKVRVRDMTMCQKMNPTAPQQCTDYNRNVEGSYDSTASLPWSLAVNSAQPPPNSNGGNGNQIGTVIGVLGGLLGGNPLGALGSIVGGAAGGQQGQGTPGRP